MAMYPTDQGDAPFSSDFSFPESAYNPEEAYPDFNPVHFTPANSMAYHPMQEQQAVYDFAAAFAAASQPAPFLPAYGPMGGQAFDYPPPAAHHPARFPSAYDPMEGQALDFPPAAHHPAPIRTAPSSRLRYQPFPNRASSLGLAQGNGFASPPRSAPLGFMDRAYPSPPPAALVAPAAPALAPSPAPAVAAAPVYPPAAPITLAAGPDPRSETEPKEDLFLEGMDPLFGVTRSEAAEFDNFAMELPALDSVEDVDFDFFPDFVADKVGSSSSPEVDTSSFSGHAGSTSPATDLSSALGISPPPPPPPPAMEQPQALAFAPAFAPAPAPAAPMLAPPAIPAPPAAAVTRGSEKPASKEKPAAPSTADKPAKAKATKAELAKAKAELAKAKAAPAAAVAPPAKQSAAAAPTTGADDNAPAKRGRKNKQEGDPKGKYTTRTAEERAAAQAEAEAKPKRVYTSRAARPANLMDDSTMRIGTESSMRQGLQQPGWYSTVDGGDGLFER